MRGIESFPFREDGAKNSGGGGKGKEMNQIMYIRSGAFENFCPSPP